MSTAAAIGRDSTVPGVQALVQRVESASIDVDGEQIAAIGRGLLVLLGVHRDDREPDADWIVRKLAGLRIFEGPGGRMDLTVGAIGGEILCVSQFTLYGDTRRGNRPSFTEAAPSDLAEPLYERVRASLGAQGGRFGARMRVALVNDGPVTLSIESPPRE
jgi:D-aminoacyl-tRNA deacylase